MNNYYRLRMVIVNSNQQVKMKKSATAMAHEHTALSENSAGQIISAAILAPSAHNTQPWQFRVAGDRIDIFIDWQRHLEISDPTKRQLYVSIGCTIANIEVAARHSGYTPKAQLPQFAAYLSDLPRFSRRDLPRYVRDFLRRQ